MYPRYNRPSRLRYILWANLRAGFTLLMLLGLLGCQNGPERLIPVTDPEVTDPDVDDPGDIDPADDDPADDDPADDDPADDDPADDDPADDDPADDDPADDDPADDDPADDDPADDDPADDDPADDDPIDEGPVLAFPGAQGFGAQATGGRGGRVFKVTNLNDSGPGSLQAALDQNEPRIIVFDVSGVIEADPIVVEHGDVTIAGQTAPGGGITIKGRLWAAEGENNIIVRHLRVLPEFQGEDGGSYDAIQLINSEQVIFDHLSVAFGVDENMGLFTVQDLTVQWSTIAMAATEGHPEGEHNYGLLCYRPRVSVHHNLFAHQKERNPALGRGPADARNNVMYNFGEGFIHHNPPSGSFNVIGNYFKRGPDGKAKPFYLDDSPGDDLGYYLANNYIDDPGEYLGIVDNPWSDSDYIDAYGSMGKDESYRSATEFLFVVDYPDYVPITTQEPLDAYDDVLGRAGAWPRDVVTRTVVEDTQQRSGEWGAHIPNNLMDGLTPGTPALDSDTDGMPDAWEEDHDLDPTDDTDNTTIMASGYTAIEVYINERAAQILP